jgi:RNA recognition motif-containing protein
MQWLYKSMLEIYPPQTTQGAIRRLFQPYGYITSVHLMADNAGRPCGFAFVTMDTYGAGKAITALHKEEVNGQQSTYGWFRLSGCSRGSCALGEPFLSGPSFC